MTRAARLIVVAILMLASPAWPADSPPDTATVRLPEVVVTALRGQDRLRHIPAASFVFSREHIQQSGVTRVSSLLQNLPGLYGYKQTSNGDVSVVDPRGFTANGESSYLKLLVDGQDVRDVENGNVDWDWLLPHDVERLEVVEGPGVWAYGDGSDGGIVNIVRPSLPDGLHSDGGVQLGSFGLASGSFVVSAQRDALAGSARASGRRVLGFRDHAREKVFSAGGEARWVASDRTRVTLNASFLDADRQDPGALRPDQLAADRDQADTPSDFAHPRRLNVGASLVTGALESSEWRISPYLRTEDVEQVRTLLYQTKDHPTEAQTVGGELGWRRALPIGERTGALSVGAQVEEATLESRYYDYADGARGALRTDGQSWRATFSGFASAELPIDARTTARLGLRHDAVRVRSESIFEGIEFDAKTFSLWSPMVALTRQIGEPVTVYGSYSAGFRVPTLNQLFDRRPIDTEFGPAYISNAELSPQKSQGIELGARHDGTGGAYALVSLYSIWVSDEIDFNAATNQYGNISKSWHRGAQLGAVQPLAGSLATVVSYTYAPTTIDGGADDGNQINAVPRHLGYGGLRWTGGSSLMVEGGVRYVGPQFLEKGNLQELPDFATVDVSGSVKLPHLRATLRVANLLDREYSDSGYYIDLGPFLQEQRLYPAAGRSFSVSLTAD